MSPPALDMEDHPPKPSIPTTDASLSNHGRGGPSPDARFACFCKLEEAERYWFAFVLYSVKRLSETNADDCSQGTGGDGFTLCQILRVAKLNIVNFFKELPQFIVKAGPILGNQYGTDWEKRLEAKELQVNFVHLSLLRKRHDIFVTFAESSGTSGVSGSHSAFSCTWTRNATGFVAPAIAAVLGALTHTLGTLVPVIGASGFATAATATTTAIGTVVGSFR